MLYEIVDSVAFPEPIHGFSKMEFEIWRSCFFNLTLKCVDFFDQPVKEKVFKMISSPNQSISAISTAEAFYRVFCALPKDDRLEVARYIIADQEIQHLFEVPNETTLEAFTENRKNMPVFHSIDELREDLLT